MEVSNRYYLLIAGSRDFHDYAYFRMKVDAHIEHLQSGCCDPVEIVIITGRASSGADDMAYHYAKRDRKLPLKEFKADWQKDGSWAGVLRNMKMVDYIVEQGRGEVIAFWDGKSPGTKQCLAYAGAQNVPVVVDLIEPANYAQPPEVYGYLYG